jgi:hypothetical protein
MCRSAGLRCGENPMRHATESKGLYEFAAGGVFAMAPGPGYCGCDVTAFEAAL